MDRFPERSRDVTSKSIDGISDLVVWAPIKDGLIDAFSNVTYETRLRQVAEALHKVRESAREHELLEPFSDTAKRILSLLDFRIGIVDRDLFVRDKEQLTGKSAYRPQRFMYLVATFDGPWEPYMRLIWRPLGYFLDLVLCNCEGYKLASKYDFETYAKWVRDHQLDSAIFYSSSGLTVTDKIYLAELEKIQRRYPPQDNDVKIARLTATEPDKAAGDIKKKYPREALRLALEAINVLYKLTDYYPADALQESGDGRLLLRAAKSLLGDYCFRKLPPDLAETLEAIRPIYKAPLDWFEKNVGRDDMERLPDPAFDASEIQKGLLTSYDGDDLLVTHGAILLMRIDDPEKTRKFLRLVDWDWEAGKPPSAFETPYWDKIFKNILFTFDGLERLGLTDEELSDFPREFRQGMADRAPLLGDKFGNHPRRWKLPERNWPDVAGSEGIPVELSEVDFAIHVRSGFSLLDPGGQMPDKFVQFGGVATRFVEDSGFLPIEEELTSRFNDQYTNTKGIAAIAGDEPPVRKGAFDWLLERFASNYPEELASPIEVFVAFIHFLRIEYGFTILGVESMFRPGAERPEAASTESLVSVADSVTTRDHFSFRDGISQPVITSSDVSTLSPSQVFAGDIVYGYRNTRGDYYRDKLSESLMFNGSFLAVRKISQNVPAFEKFVGCHPELEDGARLVGRTRDGVPLVESPGPHNDFTFGADLDGEVCPLSAHIRMANPRGIFQERKHPMILRRGMSYGERCGPDNVDAPRGIIFLAFCASLAEQYEIIQRWLNAGNPTMVSSSQNDPLTGVMPPDGERTFRFIDNQGGVRRCTTRESFTELQWGAYFFCPSKTALLSITLPRDPVSNAVVRIREGEKIISGIEELSANRQQEEWKRILEDFLTKDPTKHDISPRIWEAIQSRGGAYRIEKGVAFDAGGPEASQPVVLVTDPDLIRTVFENRCESTVNGQTTQTCPYSSREQRRRISQTGAFGTIYVSLDAPCAGQDGSIDPECQYSKEAYPTNSILLQYDVLQSVRAGYEAGRAALKIQKEKAELIAKGTGGKPRFKLELGRQYIHEALAELCRTWFGIPNGNEILKGGWDWDTPRRPNCPGDFLSPSRHAFYPRPSAAITKYGLRHGGALRKAVDDYISAHWDDDDPIAGSVAGQMHMQIKALADGSATPAEKQFYKELLGRNLIGIMIGALPPMDANLRWTIFEWLENDTLWRHQDRLRRHSQRNKIPFEEVAEAVLNGPLSAAMCIRPAPDLIYRTVEHDHVKIGNVIAEKGDLAILCLPGATQMLLNQKTPDVELIFGGNRKDQNTGQPLKEHPVHACPARDMAMGGMIGILAALLDAGRIQALPASLIVQISDWDPVLVP